MLLLRLSRGRATPVGLVRRARIVLLAGEGLNNRQIAAELGVAEKTASLWRRRFAEKGLPAIQREAQRSGRKSKICEQTVRTILEAARRPPTNSMNWTVRKLAEHTGVSRSTVQRILSANGNGIQSPCCSHLE